ncbi:MAG: TVP38/TMEM64 family protein [Opitutaceae bacterium]|nr:TVP38/TMEM64 family protein [Opitutaceae bacterium]
MTAPADRSSGLAPASTAAPASRPASRWVRWRPWLLLGVVVLALGVTARLLPLSSWLQDALEGIRRQGVFGMVVFVVLYVVCTVLFVPGSVLTLGAGAVYGVGVGSLLVSIGATLGASAAFLTGRYLARSWVQRRIESNARFAAIDRAVGREGWKIVGLTRLSPVFPFTLLNYAFGLTQVRFRDYLIASWIGMMPGTVLYVYLGSIASAAGASGGAARTPLQWTLYGVGLLATAAVSFLVTRIARRALAQRLDS